MDAVFQCHTTNSYRVSVTVDGDSICVGNTFHIRPTTVPVSTVFGKRRATKWIVGMYEAACLTRVRDDILNPEVQNYVRLSEPLILADAITRVAEFMAGCIVDEVLKTTPQRRTRNARTSRQVTR